MACTVRIGAPAFNNNVTKLTGTGVNYNTQITRSVYALTSGYGMQVRFKLDNATNNFVLGIENNDTTNRRLAIYGDGTGKLRVQYNDGGGWRYPVALTPTLQANTWYTLTILVDDVRGNTLEVYSSPSGARYAYNIGLASGKQWRFHAWVWNGSVYLDDYKEFNGGATVSPDERMQFTYDELDRLLNANKTTTDGYWANVTYNAIGNILSKGYNYTTLGYAYNDPAHKHAATDMGANQYTYDANGNMTSRNENGVTYQQQWNVENRLTAITNTTTGQTAAYTYDGDGNRVKKVQDGQTTIYVGGLYEKNVSTGVTTTYYFAGSSRIAVRQGGTLTFLLGDHLGSTSVTLDASGNKIGEMKYTPFGETRATSGSVPTDRRFTGQRQEDSGLGSLYDYGARLYSPLLGRFLSADTIVPDFANPQQLNRFSYTLNNPLEYIDPSGHCVTNNRTADGGYEQTRSSYFDCSIDELNALEWDARIWWIGQLGTTAGSPGWFKNIQTVLAFFRDTPGLEDLKGWASTADAPLLWVIQQGYRIYTNPKDVTTTTNRWMATATQAWATFFGSKGENDDVRISLWGQAEIPGTRAGVEIADRTVCPSNRRSGCYPCSFHLRRRQLPSILGNWFL